MTMVKTAVLMAGLTALFMAVGYAIGGQGTMMTALVLALLMNFGMYWFSDRMVLAMHHAQPMAEIGHPWARKLEQMTGRMCQKAGLPMPKLYWINDPTPNAFATGRSPQHAVVAVNQGLLDHLSDEEVEGVIAHELGHIANRDMLISTITATLAGAISQLAYMAMWFGGRSDEDGEGGGNPIGMLLMMILGPIAAMIIQMAVSRQREYAADRYAAELIGSGLPLANGLRRLQAVHERIPNHGIPAAEHLYIINPFSGAGLRTLFSTHPPIEDRIAKLESYRFKAA